MGAVVDAAEIHHDEGAFEVMPPNWESVRAFLACETQWRIASGLAGAVWLGLDYSAVEVVLRRTQAPDHVFSDLQVMERTALAAFAEVS